MKLKHLQALSSVELLSSPTIRSIADRVNISASATPINVELIAEMDAHIVLNRLIVFLHTQ